MKLLDQGENSFRLVQNPERNRESGQIERLQVISKYFSISFTPSCSSCCHTGAMLDHQTHILIKMSHLSKSSLTPIYFPLFDQCSILIPQTRSLGLARPHLLAPASRPLRCVVVAGKKKGGGGGGGGGGNKKKGAGIPQAAPKVARPYLTAPVIMQNLLLIESHFRKTGRLVVKMKKTKILTRKYRFARPPKSLC